MDFSSSEEQQAVRELARQILEDRATHERLLELEASGDWYDLDLWGELARANLSGIAIPEEFGGSGLGILEVCVVLEELGRSVAPVPLFPTLLLGGAPIAEFGTTEQKRRWLTPVSESEAVLSAALEEVASSDPARPRTSARRDGSGWRLDGEKIMVPAAHIASCILVPARTGPDSVGVFLLDSAASGVKLERQIACHREPQSRLLLAGALLPEDALLGGADDGAAIVDWIVERARVGLAAMQVGVAESALQRTAEYTTERVQFDKPIATFQAVALRVADAYVDLQGMRSTLLQAAWRLSEGLPASAEVAVAKWWACQAGQRVVNTAQHLHGGIGADTEYPIHRYALWARYLELTLGGASEELARLGEMLAEGRIEAL